MGTQTIHQIFGYLMKHPPIHFEPSIPNLVLIFQHVYARWPIKASYPDTFWPTWDVITLKVFNEFPLMHVL